MTEPPMTEPAMTEPAMTESAMTEPVDSRLQRLLGGKELVALRRRLRRSFERAPLDGDVARVRIGGLTPEEHAALASMVGRPQGYARSMEIDLRRLDADLSRVGIAASLRDALERLDGPILHVAKLGLERQASWSNVLDRCQHPRLRDLVGSAKGGALLKRLARQNPYTAAELCRQATAVLQRLPGQGLTRSQLAATTLGNPHALDSGRGTATLVLAVLRRAARLPLEGDAELEANERARDVWAHAGVLVNELARPALFLNLRTASGRVHGSPGEPAYASLRSLLRSSLDWAVADQDVYVCENPNLLAIAADCLGARCAPLVCTDGMPAAAQRCLLSQLTRAAARLHYHGDFDWPGLQIGNVIMCEHGASPWRFAAADYRAAVEMTPSHSLAGRPVKASWDSALMASMQDCGLAIAEEAVATTLLQDLEHG